MIYTITNSFDFMMISSDNIFEGTSGSTGISLTLAANCRGYSSSIFLPDDQASEKVMRR